jgi:hypothetical protein
MAFLDTEIEEEFAEASGGRVEFFGKDGYSFQRLGKMDELPPELVAKLRARRWKLKNPERSAAHKAKSLAKLALMDPEGRRAMWLRRKKKWLAKNPGKSAEYARRVWAKRKDKPEVKAAALARTKRWYEAAKKDPARAERLRQYKREWARKKALLKKVVGS